MQYHKKQNFILKKKGQIIKKVLYFALNLIKSIL